MRSPEEARTSKHRREAANRWSAQGVRGTITRGRTADANVNTTQLTVRSGGNLRVLAAEADGGPAGATAGDIGKLIFIPGYSAVGGPDFVPES